jgi:hypothetical protein
MPAVNARLVACATGFSDGWTINVDTSAGCRGSTKSRKQASRHNRSERIMKEAPATFSAPLTIKKTASH